MSRRDCPAPPPAGPNPLPWIKLMESCSDDPPAPIDHPYFRPRTESSPCRHFTSWPSAAWSPCLHQPFSLQSAAHECGPVSQSPAAAIVLLGASLTVARMKSSQGAGWLKGLARISPGTRCVSGLSVSTPRLGYPQQGRTPSALGNTFAEEPGMAHILAFPQAGCPVRSFPSLGPRQRHVLPVIMGGFQQLQNYPSGQVWRPR